jgi:GT2 family glycosyltransferase/glycosyltransferase involved in cell wall biosynthesis
MTRTALLIIGMHRAGTSALARVCSLRGAALPRDVLPANRGNLSGYWEPRGVTELNERILDCFDSAWNDPFAATASLALSEVPSRFGEEARRVLEDEYAGERLFVLKDPRCTLLHEFWREAIQSAGIDARTVVMMRPCEEVVESLVRRDGSHPASAALLYSAYGLQAADAARYAASFVTYRQLVDDWRAATARIAAEQSFTWPQDERHAAVEIDDFLRPVERAADAPRLPPALREWADAVWSWHRQAAEGLEPSPAMLSPVRSGLQELGALVQPLLTDRQRALREAAAIAEDLLRERDAALRAHRDTEARLVEAHEAYGAHLARKDERLKEVHETYEAQLAATTAELRRTQADYAAAADAQAQLARVLESRSWKLTAPLRRVMRVLRRDGSVDPASVGSAAPAHASDVSASRTHTKLRTFLDAEFGPAVSHHVVGRIEHFRLPVPTRDVRTATRMECDEAEALAWAVAIAAEPAASVFTDAVPDVSIVIPVYNQAPFTLACIDALLRHRTRYRFEILVGDDGSTDATQAALSVAIPGVRHVRHAQNLGFVRNCNATATHARGRHLVFLNNDTLVLPGWLDELIGTLDANPDIGLAGSKLVYPDGRLQECGAIVWRDGSAWNYGRLGDPRRPEFNYLRDVDYISGASIALRTELWSQLGGFDEAFVPAYAEDADLAFRVRDLGLRTVVQPLSQLLHFEGISSGTDLGSGAKAYQVENLRKLQQRWADVLAGHRDNAVEPELEKERDVVRRALFIDHCTPTPDEDAGSLVAIEVMQAFVANGYKVTFIPEDNFAHVGRHTRDLQRLGIEAIYHPAYPGMRAFLAARKDPFDVIFLHRFGVAAKHLDALRRAYPAARILFLNADLHYLREMRQAELDADHAAAARARVTRDRELDVIARTDVALVHSDHEQALLQRELPGTQVVLFPLVHEPAGDIPPLASRDGVCFVGGFRHPPNADGICWFVEAVWPRVIEALPGTQLYIVGSHMTPEVRALGGATGVSTVGYVEDLDGFLDRRRVSVAPLRYGAGAKGKVAGSLARGVPTVCTPVAAEGMRLEPGVNVLVGADAGELAAHVIDLLRDDARWQRLSDAGRAYARDTTSRASAHRRIREVLGLEPVPGPGTALRE